ncbi:MAG: GAF domain-containing protein [Chloroflexota bacterium]
MALKGRPARHLLRSPHFWLVGGLLLLISLFHYAKWMGMPHVRPVHLGHAIGRVLFLFPVAYASFAFGTGAGLVVCAIAAAAMLPQAIFLSPAPGDALVETAAVAFVAVASLRVLRTREQRREAFIRSLTENATDVVVVVDAAGTIKYTSLSTTRLLGYSLGELLGKNISELLHPDDLHEPLAAIRGMLRRTRVTAPVQLRLRHSDGLWRTVEVVGSNFLHDPVVAGVVFNARDVTEQRRAEEERAREHSRVGALHQVNQAVAGSLDLQAVSALALVATLKVMGMDAGLVSYLDEGKQELVLLTHRGLPPGFSREVESTPRLKLGQALSGRVAQSGNLMVVEELPQDAQELFRSLVNAGFRQYVGVPLKAKERVVGVMVLYARKKREFAPADLEMLSSVGNMVGMTIANARLFQRVEVAKREWEQTFDTVSEGVAVLSLDHRIVRANWSLARMLGTTPKELVGQHCYRAIHGAEGPRDGCVLSRCVAEKRTCEVVRQEQGQGGRWLQVCADPILDARGEVVGVVHSVSDITVERLRQERLERLCRLSQSLCSTLDLDMVVGLTLDEVMYTLGSAGVAALVALLDERGRDLDIVAARGPGSDRVAGARLPLSAFPPEFAERLLRERRPLTSLDPSQVPQAVKEMPGYAGVELRSLIVLPLIAGDHAIGVLVVGSDRPQLPEAEDMALLETLAHEVTMAIENARLYARTDEALRRRVGELEALTGVLAAATKGLDLSLLLEDVLRRAADALQVERTAFFLVDEAGNTATIQGVYERGTENPVGVGLKLELERLRMLRDAISEGRPWVVEDREALSHGTTRRLLRGLGIRAGLAAPVVLGGRAVGMLYFAMLTRPRAFSPDEVSLAQAMASHLASVVENARLHERTEEERSSLESIINSMGEGLVVVDASGTMVYCNPKAGWLWGINPADVVGHPVEVYYDLLATRIVEPTDWLRVVKKEFVRPGGPEKLRLVAQVPERREIEGTMFVIEREGRRLGMGAVLRDVTKEREVDRMKTEFISIASHELRTPMTGVYGFAELLMMRAPELSEEHRHWVNTIHSESQRLSEIVEDFLNVSRIEAGRLSLKPERLAMEPLLREVVGKFIRSHPRHQFEVVVGWDTPEVRVDRGKLVQVLVNLVDNAVKYSPAGGPVEVRAERVEGEKTVVIGVADRGLGIPEEEMPRLFSRFHRVTRRETAGLRGTGLGLYIVRSLVEMMGGRVWVESKAGEGSTFYVSLPVAIEEGEAGS